MIGKSFPQGINMHGNIHWTHPWIFMWYVTLYDTDGNMVQV